MLMPQAGAVIQPERLDCGNRLKAPAAEVATHLKGVFYRVAIDIPPGLLFTAPVQLRVPMFHERPQQRGLLFLGRVDGLEQPCIRFGVQ